METVFSDLVGAKVQLLRDAQSAGYSVLLLYFGLDSEKLSEMRVAQRVVRGGHDVPADKLQQRYVRSLRNLAQAIPFVDAALLIDNTDSTTPYRFVARFQRGLLAECGVRTHSLGDTIPCR